MKRKCSREKKKKPSKPNQEDYGGKILANKVKEEIGDGTVVMHEI